VPVGAPPGPAGDEARAPAVEPEAAEHGRELVLAADKLHEVARGRERPVAREPRGRDRDAVQDVDAERAPARGLVAAGRVVGRGRAGDEGQPQPSVGMRRGERAVAREEERGAERPERLGGRRPRRFEGDGAGAVAVAPVGK